jgi:hypothetical protein
MSWQEFRCNLLLLIVAHSFLEADVHFIADVVTTDTASWPCPWFCMGSAKYNCNRAKELNFTWTREQEKYGHSCWTWPPSAIHMPNGWVLLLLTKWTTVTRSCSSCGGGLGTMEWCDLWKGNVIDHALDSFSTVPAWTPYKWSLQKLALRIQQFWICEQIRSTYLLNL